MPIIRPGAATPAAKGTPAAGGGAALSITSAIDSTLLSTMKDDELEKLYRSAVGADRASFSTKESSVINANIKAMEKEIGKRPKLAAKIRPSGVAVITPATPAAKGTPAAAATPAPAPAPAAPPASPAAPASSKKGKGKVKKAIVISLVSAIAALAALGGLHHLVSFLVKACQDKGENTSTVQPADPQLPEGSYFDFTEEQNTAIHDLLVSKGFIKSSTQILGVKEVVCEENKTTMYFKTVIDGKEGVISMPIAQNYTALEALTYADQGNVDTKGFAMALVETAIQYKDENAQLTKYVSVADLPALSDYLAGQTEDSTVGARDIYVCVDKTGNITYRYDYGNLSALAFGDDTVYSFDDFASFKTNHGKHISEAKIIEVANMAAGGVVVSYSGQFDFNEIEILKLIALGVNANAEAATQTTTSASSSLDLSR